MISTSLTSYLVISLGMFLCGVFTIMSRRNALAVLMGIELILNSAALNFVAFSRFTAPSYVEGQVFATFVIVLAAAEAVVAFAITMAVYKYFRNMNVDQVNMLRG